MGKIKHGIKNPQSSRGSQDSGECGEDTGNFCSWFGNLEQNPGRRCPALEAAGNWELKISSDLVFWVFFSENS